MSNVSTLYNPSPEHLLLRQTIQQFVQTEVETQALSNDRREEFNLSLFRKLGELGLLGITVDTEFGGAGLDPIAAILVHEELSASDPGFCLAYLAHSMLCVNNLALNASEEQKKKFLPKLISGEWVGAMAMSEPAVGTDVLGMKTTVRRATVGGSSGYLLNGRKMWITNGTWDEKGSPAHCVLVYARLEGEGANPKSEASTAGSSQSKICSLVVEAGMKGYSVGQKIRDKTGMRASNTAELVFDQCFVPDTHLLGKEGDSLKHMMRNLEIERLTLAAMSLGIARRCLEIMNKYSTDREAFGHPLRDFGQIQKYIADSFAEFKACRTYVYETGRRMDLKKEGQRADTDAAKLVASTMAKRVADRAMQVLGGYGYVGEYVVERLWRDAKLLEIGGGTLEAHQKNITKDLEKNPNLIHS